MLSDISISRTERVIEYFVGRSRISLSVCAFPQFWANFRGKFDLFFMVFFSSSWKVVCPVEFWDKALLEIFYVFPLWNIYMCSCIAFWVFSPWKFICFLITSIQASWKIWCVLLVEKKEHKQQSYFRVMTRREAPLVLRLVSLGCVTYCKYLKCINFGGY